MNKAKEAKPRFHEHQVHRGATTALAKDDWGWHLKDARNALEGPPEGPGAATAAFTPHHAQDGRCGASVGARTDSGRSQMSDTPRTDAEAFFPHESMYQVCDADFTRQLERELNAANEHIKLLKSSGNELIEWLKDGAISDSNYRLLANAWQRAKENKQ